MKPRIGLLGGTFDPVHHGHLQIAEIARDFCNLQEVWFIPTAVPPHKNFKAVAGFNHRADMIQLALAGRPDFRLSTIEASLPEPSYTIDTLRYFQTHTTIATDFFFIIGADAFLEITTWKLYRQVLQAAHLVVFDRPGCNSGDVKDLIHKLGYEPDDSPQCWYHPSLQKKIFLPPMAVSRFCAVLGARDTELSLAGVDISSSLIRQNIKDHLSVEGVVPAAVLEYIHTHGLYA